jgi:hypothetical protein
MTRGGTNEDFNMIFLDFWRNPAKPIMDIQALKLTHC